MNHDQREAYFKVAAGRATAFLKGAVRGVVLPEHEEAFLDDFFSVLQNADSFSYRYNRYVRALPPGVAAVTWHEFVDWWAEIRIKEWREFALRCNQEASNPTPG